MGKTIGVLALQGDYFKHAVAAQKVGAQTVEVREKADLGKVDGLIIPGGESGVMSKLLVRDGLLEPLKKFAATGKPIFGTCAGAILLSADIERYEQTSLGLLDIQVKRNGYGRQIESFETTLTVPVLGDNPVWAVFIRAPVITRVGEGVEVMATHKGVPVLVRQGSVMAATFHPELTEDSRVHEYFLAQV
ncbi:MAG: pyridoxal 5'-phosphate synthase glutaminase subunit PdxT [Deltaproteobacteria bacterium]|jgi:5'-phosphate synthase pdxT subunit|nr:pyridoxal 5'-phosphate synthase glutaminase subunit PdxT [Deltaproteobacteria bacterium]